MEGAENLKLEDFVVGSLPTLFYVPDFVTESEQTQLLHHIYEVPASKWKSLKNRRLQNWGGVVHEKGLLPQELPPWLTKYTKRICQKTGLFTLPINHVLINEYLPDQGIMPHQDGPAYFPVVAIISLGSPVVMDFSPHTQLLESNQDQKLSTVYGESLAESHAEMISPFSLLLKPRSLLIFKDAAYSDYLHGISDSNIHELHKVVNVDAVKSLPEQPSTSDVNSKVLRDNGQQDALLLLRNETRVSLTCRLVPKVRNNLFKF